MHGIFGAYKPGDRLPDDIFTEDERSKASGWISLPDRTVLCFLHDYRPGDEYLFLGEGLFGVAALKCLMIISVQISSVFFDIAWCPVMARETGEPLIRQGKDLNFNEFLFLLVDSTKTVRARRLDLISPDCMIAISRSQHEVSLRSVSLEKIYIEMDQIFALYPDCFPETFFHETCRLSVHTEREDKEVQAAIRSTVFRRGGFPRKEDRK